MEQNTIIPHKQPSIYVVEDNEDIGFVLEYFLSEEGFQVKIMTTAEEFKKTVKETLPDVFLLDVMLPDGNGIELCQQIKNESRSKSLPVIMMSAHSDLKASQSCNAEEFIHKPFDLSNLLQKIKQHLPAA